MSTRAKSRVEAVEVSMLEECQGSIYDGVCMSARNLALHVP